MSSNLDVGPFGGGNTAVFQDVRASGVAPQTFNSLSDQVIEFNTVQTLKSFVSLSSNQFTLDEGIYTIAIKLSLRASSNPRSFQIWANDTSDISYGGTTQAISADINQVGLSYAYFDITIPSGGKVIEFLGRTNTGSINSGGNVVPTNGDNYYQDVRITKVG